MPELALGICDNPSKQEQLILNVDLLKDNMVVFGGHMSGKTTLLKTLLVRMHENNNGIGEEIYILDLDDNLGAYSKLYNVCACFNSSNEENIKRIFKVVDEKMKFNSRELSRYNQNFIDYCNTHESKELHHITFIIDNASAFFSEENYLIYQEMLLKFCRDGLSKGISVVLTANDTNIPSKILSNFSQKIAFELPNDKYIEAFGTRVLQPMRFKGRGLATVNSSVLEFQCFLPFENENTQLKEFIKSTNPSGEENPNLLTAFDFDLTFDNIEQYTSKNIPNDVAVLGLEYYQHTPVTFNFKEEHSVAIYGKKDYGKTNLLNLLVRHIVKNQKEIFRFNNDQDRCNFILFDDGRNQLEHIKEFLIKNNFPKRNYIYIANINDFKRYMPSVRNLHNTVFILQNRMLYQPENIRPTDENQERLIDQINNMVSQAVDTNNIFIYSDVPVISDPMIYGIFNSIISSAFLLDNIGDFVNNKGQRTIFGNMDAKELKKEYAPCERGDGYYYNFDSDILQKLKFIKLDKQTLLG